MSLKDNVVIGINNKMSASDIAKMCGVSLKEVFNVVNSLKDKGIIYYPTYNLDGQIIYTKKKIGLEAPVVLRAKNGVFSFIAHADAHVGNIYDDIKRFDVLGNYEINNDIHFVVNGGDTVDGPAHENQSIPRRLPNFDDQVSEFLDAYPLIDGVINLAVYGGHEDNCKTSDERRFCDVLREERHDFRVFSSGSGILSINGQEFFLCHDASETRIKNNLRDDQIMIAAHSHRCMIGAYRSGKSLALRFVLPSLSKLSEYNGVLSGFMRYDLEVEKDIPVGLYSTFCTFNEKDEIIVGTNVYHSLRDIDSFVKPRTRSGKKNQITK